jgi:hypothetical protein
VHSLGNFIFDMDFQTRPGRRLRRDRALDGKVMAIEPVPYVIGDDFTPRLARGEQAQSISTTSGMHSRGPSPDPEARTGTA